MSRSNIIFGTLCFAFFIYVTLRGQLPAYLSLFSAKSASASASSTNSTGGSSTNAADVVGEANALANQMHNMLSTLGIDASGNFNLEKN